MSAWRERLCHDGLHRILAELFDQPPSHCEVLQIVGGHRQLKDAEFDEPSVLNAALAKIQEGPERRLNLGFLKT
jgi:hypothetical protein